MIYRPQFAYPTPDGFRDQDSEQYFDSTVLPTLAPDTTFPNPLYNIPLTLDPDAEFLWRGVKFGRTNDTPNFGVRFRDCFNNYLSDDFVPWWLAFAQPGLSQAAGGQSIVHEPQLICPATGVVWMDMISYDTIAWTTGGPQFLSLCGIKRYDLAVCGCEGQ